MKAKKKETIVMPSITINSNYYPQDWETDRKRNASDVFDFVDDNLDSEDSIYYYI